MKYYILPNTGYVSLVGKVGCSSTALAILKAYYPDIYADLCSAAYHFPDGYSADNWLWQGKVPKTETPTGQVYQLVREPVARFLSAMVQVQQSREFANISVDDAIAQLQAAGPLAGNFHFWKQTPYTQSGQPTKLYRFPDQLQTFATDTGLLWPYPEINAARLPKPVLSADQQAAVTAFYADDVALFGSI